MEIGNVEPLCWTCHDEATRKVTADRRAWGQRIADLQRIPRERGDRPGLAADRTVFGVDSPHARG